MGLQLTLDTFTCSDVGSYMGCRGISTPLLTFLCCRGIACFTVIFMMCYWGISALVPPPPPPSLTLVPVELFLSHILIPLSGCSFFCTSYFPTSYISFLRGATTITEGLSGPSESGGVGHRGSFYQPLTEATSLAPTLLEHCHANSIHLISVKINNLL